jgi:non-ribosomal peptide synthetase component F
VRAVLNGDALRAIKATAKRHKCTPFMVLFAAYTRLLAEKTGRFDQLVGVPSIDRLPRGGQVLLGCFVNLLPVRVTSGATEGFTEVLKHAKDQLLSAYRHAQHVVHAGPWTPQATFNLEPQTVPPTFGSMKAELVESHVGHVEFDLMLNATESADALYLDLDFRLRTLSPELAREWIDRYCEILENGTRLAEQSVQDFGMPHVK